VRITNLIKGYFTCAIRNRANNVSITQVVRSIGSPWIRVCYHQLDIGGVRKGEIILSLQEAEDLGDALTRLAIANPRTGITQVDFGRKAPA